MPRKAEPLPHTQPKPVPLVGVRISTDLERRAYGIRARARWTDLISKRRIIRSEIVADEAAAHEFFDSLRQPSAKGMDVSMTLTEFVTTIGDRWARGHDPTSIGETYGTGSNSGCCLHSGTCPSRRSRPGSSTAPSMPGRNGMGPRRSRTPSPRSCGSSTKGCATGSSQSTPRKTVPSAA